MPTNLNNDVLKELYAQASRLKDGEESDVWTEKPVPFPEFVTSHLRLPPLTDRQYHDIITFLGEESEAVFPDKPGISTNGYNICVWLAGKGSGKDYMSSIIVAYVFYILMCMRDPQTYFNSPVGEAIDIVIVSFSAEQALLISFDKIKQRFKNWSWLRNRFSIIWGEKLISARGRPEIRVSTEMIVSHNNIRIISEHSANESYEGYNVLLWVMSEASAFKSLTKERNGNKVYSTLKTSASSRFPGRWKGIVMSFPRGDQESDFTYLLYQKATKESLDVDTGSRIFASRGASWEFLPANKYSGKKFQFEDWEIPIEYKEEFDTDPEECKMKYLCEPPKIGFSVVPESVILKAVYEAPNVLRLDNYVEDQLVKGAWRGLTPENLSQFPHDYLITIDLGEVQSATALGISHFEPDAGYILDALFTWTPNPDAGHVVDLLNVKDCVFQLVQWLPHCTVGFDQWQSRIFASELNQQKIKTIKYHTYEQDYTTFRQVMATGRAHIINDVELVKQFKALRLVGSKIVLNTNITNRKDRVDVVVGGWKTLDEMNASNQTDLPGYLIGDNMSAYGLVIQ